jgi:5'-nucleotidase
MLPLVDGVEVYAVPGTPADCVILGLGSLSEQPVDLVVSGINEGANLGDDVLISGTVGAAFQGYFRGLPAIAVSVAAFENIDFSVAARTAVLLAKQVVEKSLPNHVLLNVNVPNVPLEEIGGVAITRLAQRSYTDLVEARQDALGRRYYSIVRGQPDWRASRNTDIWAIRRGMISITPLQSDLVHRPSRSPLADWCATIHQALLVPGS